jgi:hypothetical protein
MVEALNAAGITAQGPGCFATLKVLDLGHCDSDQLYFDESMYGEIVRYFLALDKILPNTLLLSKSRPSCLWP